MDASKEKRARFWNKTAEKYSKSPIANEDAYRQKIEITKSHLNPSSKVLEIGCGTGSTAIIHSKYVDSIIAIDISEKMLEIAKEKTQLAGITNIEYRCLSIEELEFEEQSFDMVMAHSLLHLIEDRKSALENINKFLKPNAYFISSTACVADFLPFLSWIGDLGFRFGYLPLVKSFGAKQLIKEIKEAGFEIEYQWQPRRSEALFVIARKRI